MKKFSLVLSLMLLLTGLLGCKQKEETVEPTITGEITEIEEGRFLVISNTERLLDEDPGAVWFTTDNIESLKVGQTVSVWANHMKESYPGRARAEKIEIIE